MATTSRTSILEDLPPEIFNHILSFVYDPEACETVESEDEFSSYRFETSLLRVNKALHQVARNYLHETLSWIRFDINCPTFLIEPRWSGARYIDLNYTEPAKSLLWFPPDEGDGRRSVPQKAPVGRLHIKLEFPAPCVVAQKEMYYMIDLHKKPPLSLLVLERDLTNFMRVLWMNDVSYCHRVFPNTPIADGLRATPGLHGIKSAMTITPGQELKRYAHLVVEFKVLSGLLHKTSIIGHEDSTLAATIKACIQHQHVYAEQEELGLTTTEMGKRLSKRLKWQVIGNLMLLKHKGDGYLRQGLYTSAFICYLDAHTLETGWLKMAPPPAEDKFWTSRNFLYHHLGMCMAFNKAIAYLAGDFFESASLFRHLRIAEYWVTLSSCYAIDDTVSANRFLELTIIAVVYEILTDSWLSRHDPLNLLQSIAHIFSDESSKDAKDHLIAKGLGPLLEAIERFSGQVSILDHEQEEELETLARSLRCIAPLQWAIHEDDIPLPLREQIEFLPKIKLLPEWVVENPHGSWFDFSLYSERTVETEVLGETGSRYLI